MIERIDRRGAANVPQAVKRGGLALCPACGRPLAEPLGGNGAIAVWCRKCRQNIIVTSQLEESL